MSASNVQPASNGVLPGDLPQPEEDEPIRLQVGANGLVRVWLRHNVLGGRAGHWHEVDPAHPDLPRLIMLKSVALPDADGQLLEPPRPARRSSCCRP